MYRCKRRMNFAAQILAVPVLVMAPLASAQETLRPAPTPVVHAVGGTDTDSGQVRQVVGKQPGSNKPKTGGLLGAFGFGRTSQPASQGTTHTHNHQTATPKTQPRNSRGLLGSLFGTRTTSSSNKQSEPSSSVGSVPTPAPDSAEAWEGVPYHSTKRQANGSPTQPITDPGQGSGPAAIVRSSRSRVLPPVQSSSRQSATATRVVPQPIRVQREFTEDTNTQMPTLSATSSSRRVRTATPAPTSRRSSVPKTSTYQNDSVADLVPRVSRRSLAPNSSAKPTPKAPAVATELKPKVAAKPVPKAPEPKAVAAETAPKPTAAKSLVPTPSQDIATARTKLATPTPLPAYQLPVDPASKPAAEPQLPKPTAGKFVSRDSNSTVGSGLAPNVPSADLTRAKPESSVSPSADVFQPLPAVSKRQPALPSTGTTAAQAKQSADAYTASRPLPRASSTDSAARSRVSAGSLRKLKPGETSTSTELPGIRVVTYGPGQIMIRQTHQYEVVVENRGAIAADGLLVRVEMPDWADAVAQKASLGSIKRSNDDSADQMLWTINSLPAGKSERLFIDLKAARSGNYNLDIDWTLLPQQAVTKIHVQEPKLKLTIEGPEEVIYGQSQTYHVRVLNPGDGPAPNVVFTLSPNSETPQSQEIGDIPAGKEAQFDIDLTAQDLGELKIHGLAKGKLDLKAEAIKTIAVASADLEATLSGPELKYQNTEAIYRLKLQNNGTATSENVEASLLIPAGAEYVSGIEGARVANDRLVWKIKSLPRGFNRDYECKFNMSKTGSQEFKFSCEGSAAGAAHVALETRVEAIADLVLTVMDPPAPAPIGTDVTYEIVIRNRGSKAANAVQAIAQFSHGIEPQRISGQTGKVVTGRALFDAIAEIKAGEEVRLKVVAKAEVDGHHRFRTEIRSAETVLVAEEATHYMKTKSDRVSRTSSDNDIR